MSLKLFANIEGLYHLVYGMTKRNKKIRRSGFYTIEIEIKLS